MSWSSVAHIETIGQAHGVPAAVWPIFREHENEWEVSLDEARARSEALREAIVTIPSTVIESEHWLGFFAKLLAQGHSFLILV